MAVSRWSISLFAPEEWLELGVFFDEVFGKGADDIDAQGILLGILKRRGDKF